MRISIWQQFSSNHSSNFTVVGIFPTAEQAKEKADLLLKMITDIHEAREQLADQKKWKEMERPIPLEIALSEEYNVEWSSLSLDWAWQFPYAVRQIDNYVVVQNVIDQTNNGPKPFDQLMERLGGQALVAEGNKDINIEVDISAEMSDEQAIDGIYNQLLPYFNAVITDSQGYRYIDLHVSPSWESFVETIEFQPGAFWDQSRIYDGYLSKNGMKLDLSQLNFIAVGIGLTALLGYLKAKGITNIHYSLRLKESL